MRINRVIHALLLASVLSVCAVGADSRGTHDLSTLSLAAQPPISAALGRDLSAYWAQAKPGGFRAADFRHQLTADFTAGGVEVRYGPAEWRVQVCGYGYGEALQPVAMASPEGSSNRVQYHRGPMTEWYVNGPVGLEQGFTVDKPPDKRNGHPFVIALNMSGNLTAVNDGHEGLSLLDRKGALQLRYSGLSAYDSTGSKLPAWLQLQDEQLLLKVDDRAAHYPIVIDPWVQTAELTTSDGAANDQFSWSVAVSGDTVVVGAPFHAVGADTDQGVAYVFVKPQSGWGDMTQTAELAASNGAANAYFGSSVAISGDTVVIGAGGTTVNGNPHQGAAYVFVKPAGGWTNMTQTAALIASDGYVGDNFGASVAIDGHTLVGGAPYASIGMNSEQGAVYVFVEPGNGWTDGTQTAKLTASDGAANDVLGVSLAISGDTVVAGASGATVAGNASAGTTYVFVKPANGWIDANQTAELTASDLMPDDYFGSSVALSGNTVVVGAPSDFSGAAYVFVESNIGWTDMSETAELTVSGGQSQLVLGTSVAITGNTVIAGAVGASQGGKQYQGKLFVFVEPQGGWANMTQTSQLTSSDGAAGDYFGRSLAISGSTGVAGAPFHQVGSNDAQGAAYVFQTLNKRPLASSLSPDNAIAGGSGFSLTVQGANFVPDALVNWSGSPRSTTYVNATELQASILASDIAKVGKFNVTVTNPPPGGGTSNGLTFTVNNPEPTIQTLNPDHATAGDPAFTLTVNGSNFVQGAQVQGNGLGLNTTFVSSTKVTAIVPSGAIAKAGTGQITVVNPPPGGGRSNALTFTINNPLPALTRLQPSSAKAGGPGFTLTVYGSGFVTTSQVMWKGSPRATTYFGPGKLQAKISASDISKAGTAKVTVSNPAPGGGTSNALTFTISP